MERIGALLHTRVLLFAYAACRSSFFVIVKIQRQLRAFLSLRRGWRRRFFRNGRLLLHRFVFSFRCGFLVLPYEVAHVDHFGQLLQRIDIQILQETMFNVDYGVIAGRFSHLLRQILTEVLKARAAFGSTGKRYLPPCVTSRSTPVRQRSSVRSGRAFCSAASL